MSEQPYDAETPEAQKQEHLDGLKFELARDIGQVIINISMVQLPDETIVGIDKAVDLVRVALEKAVPLVRQADAQARKMLEDGGMVIPDALKPAFVEAEFVGQYLTVEVPSSNIDGQ